MNFGIWIFIDFILENINVKMPFLHKPRSREPLFIRLQKEISRTGLRDAIFYPSGGYYKGEWLNGLQSGKGKQLLLCGRQYEGDWACNKEHGFGVQSCYDAEERRFRLTYIGDHCNGKMDGFGRRHFADGSVYEGEFKNNEREGFGRCWYVDNSYYEGQWSKDQCNGFGMFVQVNGNRYEGEWKNGKKDGWGRFYHLDSGQIQDGFWTKGICTTSSMSDLNCRQSALEPTPYPIPRVNINPDASCFQLLNQASSMILKGNYDCELRKNYNLIKPWQNG